MTAVCYRCFYRGPAREDQKCPACDFALITEADEPTCEKHLADIMGRYSVRAGAPKLPGIKTHHGLASAPKLPGVEDRSAQTGAPKKRFLAVGTVPPPRTAEDIARAQRANAAVSSSPSVLVAPVPKVAAKAPAVKARIEAPAPPTRRAVVPAEPQSLVRRSFGFIEVTCVLLGALAAGVGAAFLGTAL